MSTYVHVGDHDVVKAHIVAVKTTMALPGHDNGDMRGCGFASVPARLIVLTEEREFAEPGPTPKQRRYGKGSGVDQPDVDASVKKSNDAVAKRRDEVLEALA